MGDQVSDRFILVEIDRRDLVVDTQESIVIAECLYNVHRFDVVRALNAAVEAYDTQPPVDDEIPF